MLWTNYRKSVKSATLNAELRQINDPSGPYDECDAMIDSGDTSPHPEVVLDFLVVRHQS